MPTYTYNIQANNKYLSEFIYGENWLIGATSENNGELLRRLKPFSGSATLNENEIRNTIFEFVEWYKQDFEKRENEPCLLEDDEIVLGVGFVKLDTNKQASIFRLGSFGFYLASNPKSAIKSSTITLNENDTLIIDPKNAEIAEKINTDNLNQLTDYNFPFAIIQPKIIQEKPTPSSFKYILFSIGLVGLLSLVWLYQDKITSLLHRNTDSTQSMSDTIPMMDSTIAIDDSLIPVDSTKYTVEDIKEKGAIALNQAKEYMNTGQNRLATQKLDSLESFVLKMASFDYEDKKDLYNLLNEIKILKAVVNDNIEIDTVYK